VKPGTGLTEGQNAAYCPYCQYSDEPSNFATEEQVRYVQDIASREANKAVGKMLEETLGFGPTRRQKIGDGLVSIEMTYEPGRLPHVRRPLEEELRRDINCPNCGLEHAVFGLATWCPDCGSDIFISHVEEEFRVVRKVLDDVGRRHTELGARVAARDVENALEDTVSIFEAVLRALTRRHMKRTEIPDPEINEIFRKRIGNRYQNVDLANQLCSQELGVNLFEGFDQDEIQCLKLTFEKRHPITHNLGIIDRKYLEKVRSDELEGRDVRVSVDEVCTAIDLSMRALGRVHTDLFCHDRNKSDES